MREKPLGRAARVEETCFEERHDEACGRFIVAGDAERDAAPRPGELIFEIGLAIAGFLSVAVIANLFVVARQAG